MHSYQLQNDCDIYAAFQQLKKGDNFSQVVGEERKEEIRDDDTIGYMFFSKVRGKGILREFLEITPKIFPDTRRIFQRNQLEEILSKTRKIRTINKWFPFLDISLDNLEKLCEPEFGSVSEEFIQKALSSNNYSNEFYMDIPYWSEYQTIGNRDLVLQIDQF